MKKSLFKHTTALALFFGASTLFASEGNPVKLIESSANESIIKVDVSSYGQKPANGEFVITTPYGNSILQKGCPDVPKFSISLAVPSGAHMSYEIIAAKYTDHQNIDVAPSKGTVSRKYNISDIPYVKGSAYTKNAFFPTNIVEWGPSYILRDVNGQAVYFQPFQYNPVTRTLRVYTELTVRIYNLNASKASALKLPEHVDQDFMSIYQSQFLNASSLPVTPPLAEGGKMLIICNDAYMSAMAPFVAWKKQIGIPTTMVAISAVGNNTASIKNYVANYYNTNGLSYLLLVGDAQHITPMTFTMSGNSDNGYGYIVGNDRYPDIMVGRFSAETNSHVTTMVNRTIAYEKNPTPNATWYKRAMGIASDQGPGNDNQIDYQHMRSIRGQLLAYTYTNVTEMYDGSQGLADAAGNPSSAMVAAEINTGVSLINYVGHGSNTSWATSGFNTTGINALTNNGKWPFIISVGCINGNFNGITCFAETWLRAANASGPTGAVATIMSTINQYWDEPMEGQDMMDTILCEAISNNIKRSFGGIAVNGLYKMNDFYGASGMDMTDTWTIFGDPSVIVRTDNPTPMTVSHSTLEAVGVTQLAINCNKNGAIVCLTKQGNILGTGVVSSGSVNITFPAINSIDSIDVTVTAYNCVPYFGKTYVQCPAQLMTLNSNNVAICTGNSATLTASGATSYTWSTSSSLASIVVNPTSNTTYTVTGTLNNVCYESQVVNVTVNQLPNVTFNQNPTNVCLGASGLIPLNGLPTGGSYVGNGVSGTNFDPNTAGAGNHFIIYTYVDANSCMNTASITMNVSACAGLTENSLNSNFMVYPNPGKDAINIKADLAQDAQLTIYNALGDVIHKRSVKQNTGIIKIETSEFARGMYFAKIKSGDQTQVVKFILE